MTSMKLDMAIMKTLETDMTSMKLDMAIMKTLESPASS